MRGIVRGVDRVVRVGRVVGRPPVGGRGLERLEERGEGGPVQDYLSAGGEQREGGSREGEDGVG